MSAGSVLVDIAGTQSLDHRDRGIARYIFELALALEDVASDRVGAYLLNPDLALPGGLDRLLATGKLRSSDEVTWPPGGVLHVASPYELSVPLRRLLPDEPRLPLVVTVYDLIPEMLADPYLADPGLRQRYRARHQLVRSADAVLTLSEATRRDAIDRLGLDPARVSVAGAGVDGRFVPPSTPREAAARAAAATVPGLRPPYVLYTGGTDERKNVDRLLEAWAGLPEKTRRRHQLVVACRLKPLERNHFEVLAGRLGVGGSLLLPGFVPDDVLLALYQGAQLFVYPSLYEGYGLPVAEALACGAPVVAANTSCLPELVSPPALFDPFDPGDMAAALERALTDDGVRRELLGRAGRAPCTWTEVAKRTATAYDGVLDREASTDRRRRRPRRPAGRRPRVAFATPLPPQPSGVADYSYLLLDELRHHAEVHAFVDGPPHHRGEQRRAEAPPGVGVHRLAGLARAEAIEGRYDAVVYSLGNSEFHTGALAALRTSPGIVLAHDVRLTDLYAFAPHQHPRAAPGGFAGSLQTMYDGRVPADLGHAGHLDAAEAERWGVFMAREVIALSERFWASSTFAAELARLDAAPGDRHKIDVLPLAIGVHAAPPPPDPAREELPPVVVSFGLVNATKQARLLVEAFGLLADGHREARLAVVGPCGEVEAGELRARAGELGLGARFELTGRVSDEEYRGWLARATVAVQLRTASNGETSGAAGACLASGVPTVVSALGAARDLPDDAAVKVRLGGGPAELAGVVAELLGDPERRRRLGKAAAAYAGGRSFAHTAERLMALLEASGFSRCETVGR